MKLSLKWFMWFTIIGAYVMVLGGVFYYNLFKWTFDEKLKQDMLEMVRIKSPELIKGLARSPKVITFDEYDVMDWMRTDKRIVDIIYINGSGTLRWHRKPEFFGMPYEDYDKTVGVPTDVIAQAYYTGSPKVRQVPKQPFYDMAIPLKAKGEVILGIVYIQVSREGADKVISSAMRKYVFGAIGVLFLLGIPLYLFLSHYVVSPLNSLRESIESISTKSFEMKFANRRDEIGELADSISSFLEKVRSELASVSERDSLRQQYEAQWWQMVLDAAVNKGTLGIVVDEDNSVLFSNFQLSKSDPNQKMHLLDVVDSQQQDVLRLIGMAMDAPGQLVEGDTTFRNSPAHLKVVAIQSENAMKRTLILLEPRSRAA